MKKTLIASLCSIALVGGLFVQAAPAFAGGKGDDPSAKCNAGRGNNSETEPTNDCDPGNSGLKNKGGD